MTTTPVRNMNLVLPLACPATDERTTETTARNLGGRSGAASPVGNREGGMNSKTHSSTAPTTRTFRTSRTVTRTSTTRTTPGACAPSADLFESISATAPHADFSFDELVQAYFDCRISKRNSASALAFEINLEPNLVQLDQELRAGSYTPGQSICFAITRPKPREVWAAQFRDRVVHHLMYNRVAPPIEARFIADSCACIKGRGTLYAAKRLEKKAASITQGWQKSAHYLKCDLANFFVRIDKRILRELLAQHIKQPWWLDLATQILMHDPRTNYELRGSQAALKKVPDHKRLTNQDSTHGLPIGNLSSQFFANIYLNELDQFVKHELRCRHYIRYVDDFVLLHESPQWLNAAKAEIEQFLHQRLAAQLNPTKTIIQPVHRSIDFVGQVIFPHHRLTRKRTLKQAMRQAATAPHKDLHATVNSYFGLLRQASHHQHHRAQLARTLLLRGRAVNIDLTKIYARRA